jgi:uncharacterized protein
LSRLVRLRPEGRGRNYSPLRGLAESALRLAYARDWPGRAWGLVPRAAAVQRLDHHLIVPRSPDQGVQRPPLRLAFVSDLHLGPTTAACTLDRAFAFLAEAAPDVLILGGDYVFLDATRRRARELTERVAAVPARTKLAVLGNHDLWADQRVIERALTRAGARVLVNEAVRLPAPHDDIAVLGLDDPWTGRPDAAPALAVAAGAAALVAVCHSPDGVPFLRGTGARLLLAGHTHGGQVALPGPRPIVVPGALGKRWPFGRHSVDVGGDVGGRIEGVSGLTLFVSRGVGASEVPIRMFAPPDVAVFTLDDK